MAPENRNDGHARTEARLAHRRALRNQFPPSLSLARGGVHAYPPGCLQLLESAVGLGASLWNVTHSFFAHLSHGGAYFAGNRTSATPSHLSFPLFGGALSTSGIAPTYFGFN